MRLMECRENQLQSAIEGLTTTDIPLIAFNDKIYSAAGYGDDEGIYYFIPWIAKTFDLSLKWAINLFFGSQLVGAALIAILCFFMAFKHWSQRSISFVTILLLTWASFRYSDVYITFFFTVTSIIPLFILAEKKSYNFNPKLIALFIISGILAGYSNFIRSHAGTGTLLFSR